MFPTHADAPRVLIANSNLVPHWATWEHFHELDRKGLAMYGQMTAGSWIYIGSQGIVQGTYETFAEMGRRDFGGELARQVDFDRGTRRHGRRAAAGGHHGRASACWRSNAARAASPSGWRPATSTRRRRSLDEALGAASTTPGKKGKPVSVGAARQCRRRARQTLLERGIQPDALTDQTSAHDPGQRLSAAGVDASSNGTNARRERSRRHERRGRARSMAKHVEYLLRFKAMGLPVFDYGNNIRQVALKDEGVARRLRHPGFRARVHPSAVLPRHRTVPLGRALGRSGGHLQDRCEGQGADPATMRICIAGSTWRARASNSRDCPRASAGWASASATASGLAFNEMVASGELKAPIVIGRDHLDSGSVASPNRETEAMRDGSDAVSDWPLLNALLNTASGATWVSIHHGGGVGMGYSQHAGVVIVCDGSEAAARRIRRVLWNDPGTGVMRHADAGYQIAIDCAREQGLDLPMIESRQKASTK